MNSPLDLAEIRFYIGQYLDIKDMCACIRVCQSWHASFTPFLYRDLVIYINSNKVTDHQYHTRDHFRHPTITQLEKNKHHVRSLDLRLYRFPPRGTTTTASNEPPSSSFSSSSLAPPQQNPHPSYLPSHFPALTRLTLGISRREDKENYSDLIKTHARTLLDLSIDAEHAGILGPAFWEATAHCRQLTKLSLENQTFRTIEQVAAFWKVCCHGGTHPLRDLTLMSVNFPPRMTAACFGGQETRAGGASMGVKEEAIRRCHIDTLYVGAVWGNHDVGQSMYLWMMEQCTDLRSLTWTHDHYDDVWSPTWFPVDGFSRSLAAGCWPCLDNFDVGDHAMLDGTLAKVLDSMADIAIQGRLRELRAQAFGVITASQQILLPKRYGLETFNVRKSAFGPLAMEALLRVRPVGQGMLSGREGYVDGVVFSHSLSLSHLDLRHCKGLLSSMAQRLMEECPRLSAVALDRMEAGEITRGKPWVCTGLMRMETAIILSTFETGDPAQDRFLAEEECRDVFKSLGRLVHLLHLSILPVERGRQSAVVRRGLGLRLQDGLAELAGLKSLSWISLGYAQEMEPEEVEWIGKCWPGVKSICGRLHSDQGRNQELINSFAHRGIIVI